MKKHIMSLVICLAMVFSLTTPAFASDTGDGSNYAEPSQTVQNDTIPDPFSSPTNYIKYLESFGREYSAFLSQFKSLSLEKQEAVLSVLSSGGTLDVIDSKSSKNIPSITPFSTQKTVWAETDYGLFGITFVTVRLEGRFTCSGATVETAEYKNAYIVKNWVPLTGFERTSLDAYVSGGRFYASAAFTAYVGAKIGDNIIGVTPRTFYISLNCDGSGDLVIDAS